jgi:hypothetical protein
MFGYIYYANPDAIRVWGALGSFFLGPPGHGRSG